MKFFTLITFLLFFVACSTSKYVLPYPKGTSYNLIQGWNGPWGHQGEGAYDFNMPIGSVITAARAGKVVKLEEQFVDNNRKPGEENYLYIEHSDGTFSRYYHLTQNGVLVELGDLVNKGDTVALSGNTGASAGPHLHFDVTKECPEWGCQTIPFKFKKIKDQPLTSKNSYEAH